MTHVDYSARIQTVDSAVHPDLHSLLLRFDELTGCAVLVNTSFNIRGEPIVCTPQDAYRCFLKTEMDALIIGNFLLFRNQQNTGLGAAQAPVRMEDLEPSQRVARIATRPKLKEKPSEWRKFVAVWCGTAAILSAWLLHRGRLSLLGFAIAESVLASALALGLVRPRWFRIPYRLVMTLSHAVSRPMTVVILTVFYFGAMTPLGFILRWMGQDALRIKWEPRAESYWTRPGPPRSFRRLS